jgi:hypothetical protein
MSDTPRTDAETYDIEVSRGDCWLEKNACSNGDGDNVSADFARQLERELAAAKDLAESTGRRQTRVCMFCGMESAAGNTQTERRKP